MAEKLTPQQEAAVKNRGGKLLVSAAAGSGKTKVLVDRLLSYITDPVEPANVDDFLIITFTKAAAAELRVKIAQKLSERIAVEPTNRHLQNQMQRLYMAKISTVDSFCADIIRENAYRLDIPADFYVIEERDSLQLKLEAIDTVLEAAYQRIHEDPQIRDFLDCQGLGRNDRQIPPILLGVHRDAGCHKDPDGWLSWCETQSMAEGIDDASQTVWGAYLVRDLHQMLDMNILAVQNCAAAAERSGQMPKVVQYLSDMLQQLKYIRSLNSWDEISAYPGLDYGRLTFPKNCTDLKLCEQIKIVREKVRDELVTKLRRFSDSSEQILHDLRESGSSVKGLIKLVRQFGKEYDRLKRRRKALDFTDIEHKTLDLLYGKSRSGITSIAKEIGARFREVMVDEYQDSNAVQDAIYAALTQQRQNCFMVGDVKQSIYQFRLADPSIFVDKYNSYVPAELAEPGQGRKLVLSKNFRSGGGVIEGINDVFSCSMSPEVGGLSYNADEMLYEGIPHISLNEPEIEFYTVDAQDSAADEEADFVAERISQLTDGTHMIREGDGLRPIRWGDIVILLRSPRTSGGHYIYAMEQRGIPCTMDGGIDLLQTEEISNLVSLLQILQNPQQDIPLVAVMCSRIFGFTADDLAKLRGGNRRCSVYEALRNTDSDKAKHFLSILDSLRHDSRIYRLSELISRIIDRTKLFSIYNALPDGDERMKNLQHFIRIATDFANGAQRDLGQFLEYIQAMEDGGLVAEGDKNPTNSVRIMTIHASKGLEYPVVILGSLSRALNTDSIKKPVLCHKDLGIGLNYIDTKQRVRYPTIAKSAIAARITEDSVSEELRVLYVAMTRARDRLIMTYSKRKFEEKLTQTGLRMEMTPMVHMNKHVSCIGDWVLHTALRRTEAGELFALSGNLSVAEVKDSPWIIKVVNAIPVSDAIVEECLTDPVVPESVMRRIADGLSFQYPHLTATTTPTKQTATQLKGRDKDKEAAENTAQKRSIRFRKPSFISRGQSAAARGDAVHRFMQFARFECCMDMDGLQNELDRAVHNGLLSADQAQLVDLQKLLPFFTSEMRAQLLDDSSQLLREFKFSVLVDADKYVDGIHNEKILLQGVVDCALIQPDGIVVVDFKTDYVTEETSPEVKDRYRMQVKAYCQALEQIYKKPVIASYLYLFHIGRFEMM